MPTGPGILRWLLPAARASQDRAMTPRGRHHQSALGTRPLRTPDSAHTRRSRASILAPLGVDGHRADRPEDRGDAHRFAREAADDRRRPRRRLGRRRHGQRSRVGARCIRGVPLAIVPAGSGNGLASDLRIAVRSDCGARRWPRPASTSPIDAGQVHDSLFFNIAGIGVDAVIAARFAERGLRRPRPARLPATGADGARCAIARRPTRSPIDDERTEHRAMLIAIANGRQYGNRVLHRAGREARRWPAGGGDRRAAVDRRISPGDCRRCFAARCRRAAASPCAPCAQLRVSAAGAIPFHVDGEPRVGPAELAVVAHRHALSVKTPAGLPG